MSHWQCFLHLRPDDGPGHRWRLGRGEGGEVVPHLDHVANEGVPRNRLSGSYFSFSVTLLEIE